MICGTCHGDGYINVQPQPATILKMWEALESHPCPECNGSGVTSCCEGPVPCDETAGKKK